MSDAIGKHGSPILTTPEHPSPVTARPAHADAASSEGHPVTRHARLDLRDDPDVGGRGLDGEIADCEMLEDPLAARRLLERILTRMAEEPAVTGSDRETAVLRIRLGAIASRIGEHPVALELLLAAREHYDRHPADPAAADCLAHLGIALDGTGRHEAGLEHLERALALYRGGRNRLGTARALAGIARIHAGRGMSRRSLAFLDRARKAFIALEARDDERRALVMVATALEAAGAAGATLELYRRALALLPPEAEGSVPAADLHGGMAAALVALGRHREAREHLELALEWAGDQNGPTECRLREIACRLYHGLGMREQAFASYGRFADLREILRRDAMRSGLMRLQRAFERKRIERRVAGERRNREELARELEERAVQIGSVSAGVARANEILEDLRRRIDRPDGSPGACRDARRGAPDTAAVDAQERIRLADLAPAGHAADGMQALALLSEDGAAFAGRLADRFPMLTAVEIKVCTLVRAGLGSKEIASVLHISPRTAELHRTNIRRKCRLRRADSLALVLARV